MEGIHRQAPRGDAGEIAHARVRARDERLRRGEGDRGRRAAAGLERDLPRIIEGITSKHKELRITVTPPLDAHPALVQILLDRVRAAIA